MAQLFHSSANIAVRVGIIGAGLLTVGLVAAGVGISRSPWNTKVGIPKDQPVPFSHQHHATELGVDCRYCHTNVEKAAWVQLPPTQTCYTCHSQIWTNSPLLEPVRTSYAEKLPIEGGWNQLNSVPDFVYFNHSIHVNRGVNCNTCHGPIQKEMLAYKGKAFFMSWCLNCHRSPESFVNAGGVKHVFSIYEKYQAQVEDPEDPDYKTMHLTPEERKIADGIDYQRNAAEREQGEKWLKEYKVQTKQLTDCSVCHR